MTRKWTRQGLRVVVVMALGLVASCSDEAPRRSALVGESCLARSDCASGLVCVEARCVPDDYTRYIEEPSPKRCELLECVKADDCCPQSRLAACVQLEASCEAGEDSSCDDYDAVCRCDVACEEGVCVHGCEADGDCPTGYCGDGRCVECVCDAHCGADQVCRDQTCQLGCDTDAECPALYACDQGVCIPSGCKTDRECVAANSTVLANCVEGRCRVQCSYDRECRDYSVSSLEWANLLPPLVGNVPMGINACIDGFCQELGCLTDTECRAWIEESLGPDQRVECREPVQQTIDVDALPPASCDAATGGGGAGGTGGAATGGSVIIIIGLGGTSTGGVAGSPEILCADTCTTSMNGVCEDGGPQSTASDCAYGTDCTDCGARDPSGGAGGAGGQSTGGASTGGIPAAGAATGGVAPGGAAGSA